jgi:hypothetical protein
VLGVLSSLTDVTDRVQAVTDLRQANARLQRANTRLDLLERAASQIGGTLDIRRTAQELADLAVPELADRIVVDLCDAMLRGENVPRPGSDPLPLRFRRVAARDAKPGAKFGYKVDSLITAPVTSSAAVALLRGKPLLARNRAEIRRQVPYTPNHAEVLLARGVHTVMALPLIARGVTLGVAILARAEHPEPYGEVEVRLASDLAARAAVHIDNARLYTREHDAAVTLQRSLLPCSPAPPHRRPADPLKLLCGISRTARPGPDGLVHRPLRADPLGPRGQPWFESHDPRWQRLQPCSHAGKHPGEAGLHAVASDVHQIDVPVGAVLAEVVAHLLRLAPCPLRRSRRAVLEYLRGLTGLRGRYLVLNLQCAARPGSGHDGRALDGPVMFMTVG